MERMFYLALCLQHPFLMFWRVYAVCDITNSSTNFFSDSANKGGSQRVIYEFLESHFETPVTYYLHHS